MSNPPDLIRDVTGHREETLFIVRRVLSDVVGFAESEVTLCVDSLLAAGVLFRERWDDTSEMAVDSIKGRPQSTLISDLRTQAINLAIESGANNSLLIDTAVRIEKFLKTGEK